LGIRSLADTVPQPKIRGARASSSRLIPAGRQRSKGLLVLFPLKLHELTVPPIISFHRVEVSALLFLPKLRSLVG